MGDDFAVIAKFMDRVQVSETGCWEWTGKLVGRESHRYPRLYLGAGRWVGAHRLSISLFLHPLADDLLACHTCDNTRCVNPDHLYAGTHRDNTNDMYERNRRYPEGEKTRCVRGHERTPENLRGRQCKECVRINQRAYRARGGEDREAINARRRERYATDPEFRSRLVESSRRQRSGNRA